MHPWDPATEAEAAMREALASGDQDRYFRLLSRSDLLLPVSAESLAGRAPVGWGTWTTGNRTHILAFTSPTALRLCLNEPGGTYRAVPFHALAADWPNYEWWLAINPGLPIEAYLPAWFLTQMVRGGGEVHLPGRSANGPRARMGQSDLASAISGRIRASGSAAPRRPESAYAPPRDPRGDEGHPPRRDPRREESYGSRRDEGYGYGWRGDDGYGSRRDDGYGYPRSPGYTPSAPTATPGGGTPGQALEPVPDPFEAYRQAARAAAASGQPPVETVDAEIVGDGGTGGHGGGYGASSGLGNGGHRSGPGPTQPYPGSPAEPTSRFAERDLGARLRAQQAHAGAAAGRAEPSAAEPTSWTPRRAVIEDAEIVSPEDSWAVGFVPANETEAELLAAAITNNTDSFLSTLLLARVILPVPISMPPGSRPRDKYFPWPIQDIENDERLIPVFTSPERLADYGTEKFGPSISTMSMRFIELIEAWPSERIQFAINPGTPVGTTLPGSQIVALASWAAEVGLRGETPGEVALAARRNEPGTSMGVAGAPAVGAATAIVMQRAVPPAQVPFYLERGYDRVSGFVNRASEVAHLRSPRVLYRALGLVYPDSPFAEDDAEVHVLRWVAHRPDLYRLPYGGQNESAMRAMQGWIIERAPFRGNGFAPGEGDVVSEFKVDSARLPHGAQMWRLTRDGMETLVASFDADSGRWVGTP